MRAAFAAWPVLFALLASNAAALASPQALSAREWRADLEQLSAAIEDRHPQPFARMSEDEFNAALADLRRAIPRLDDKEIMARMAAIVGMAKDGHTRLSLPREYPGIGLEFGHSAPQPPAFDSLKFAQLPLAFEGFSDGIYVTGADAPYADYIGYRLVSIGDRTAAEAMAALAPYTYAENVQLERLMGADLLSLPEILVAANVAHKVDEIPVQLEDREGGEITLDLAPMSAAPDWRRARRGAGGLGPDDMATRKFWSTYLPERNIVYARIDEIGDAQSTRLAEFVMAAVENAETQDARLVVDIRNNFGGDASFNRTLILALIQSEELNTIGRTFLLTGPRTFSAAQLLVNALERYTWALFAGAPTGSRPDHFGDARRIQLKNSGLTLRVSTVHWSSSFANDAREATNPDIPAPWTGAAYFSGPDPALEAVAAFSPGADYIDLFEAALRRGDHYQIARYLTLARLSPQSYEENFARDLLALGERFEAEGETDLARFSYRYGLFFFEDDEALAAALAGLDGEE